MPVTVSAFFAVVATSFVTNSIEASISFNAGFNSSYLEIFTNIALCGYESKLVAVFQKSSNGLTYTPSKLRLEIFG